MSDKPMLQLKSHKNNEPDEEKMKAFLSGGKASAGAIEQERENVNVKVNVNAEKGCFNDTYKRHTIFIHNDLDKQIKKAIRGKRKGEKTAIINTALAEYFARRS